MITKEQFDKLLKMTMLDLTGAEYQAMYNQIDSITGFIDSINNIEVQNPQSPELQESQVKSDRSYKDITIDLAKGTSHPLANKMIQIKFKRS